MRWVCATAAPWALGAGLLVSFTAAAGHDLPSVRGARLPSAVGALLDTAAMPPPSSGTAADAQLLFNTEEGAFPASRLTPGPIGAEAESGPSFVPSQSPDPTTTRQATSAPSPAATASGATAGAIIRTAEGTTPPVSRAVALSSTTPAPPDATPIEIAAVPVSLPAFGAAPRLGEKPGFSLASKEEPAARPRYADLVDPDSLSREQRCLAEAVYFEARSEPEEGQAAVAQVVLNRAKSGLYPSSICGVVYQNRHRYLACQFTFACEGKSLRITDADSWRTASRVAKEVLEGKTYLAEVGGSTHYHADYVRPSWSRKLKKMDTIGRHIFYKLRPGQT